MLGELHTVHTLEVLDTEGQGLNLPACTLSSRACKMWVCCPAFQVLGRAVCIRVWAEKEFRGIFESFLFFLASISVLCGTGCIFFVVFTSYISSGRCTIMENFILPSVPRVFVCGQRCTKGKRLSEHKRAQSVKECSPGLSLDVCSKLGAAMSSFTLGCLNKDPVHLARLTTAEIYHLKPFPSVLTSHSTVIRSFVSSVPKAAPHNSNIVTSTRKRRLGRPLGGARADTESPFPRKWRRALLIHRSRPSGFWITATNSLNRGQTCVENLGIFPLEHLHVMCLRAKYESRDKNQPIESPWVFCGWEYYGASHWLLCYKQKLWCLGQKLGETRTFWEPSCHLMDTTATKTKTG